MRSRLRAALRYWQYPTDYGVTTTDKLDSAPEPTKAIAVDAVTSASHLAERLTNAVRGPNALMNKLVCSPRKTLGLCGGAAADKMPFNWSIINGWTELKRATRILTSTQRLTNKPFCFELQLSAAKCCP